MMMITAAIKVSSECFITTKQQSVNNIFYYKQLQLHDFQQELTEPQQRPDENYFLTFFLRINQTEEEQSSLPYWPTAKCLGLFFGE